MGRGYYGIFIKFLVAISLQSTKNFILRNINKIHYYMGTIPLEQLLRMLLENYLNAI